MSAPAPDVSVAEVLVGREADLQLLTEFLGAATEGGASLLLTGQAGVGKTALLDAAAEHAAASGALVLRAQGVEFEADLSFAGLHQLLVPLTSAIARLGPAPASALSAALGLSAGATPERGAVVDAARELLRVTAAAVPVLVVVDDPQWLDRSSAAALSFLSRELSGSPIGVLIASRSGYLGHFEPRGMRKHMVEPLDPDAAARLLARRYLAPNARVRQRLLLEAAGNPLALLELPLAMTGRERDLVGVLPVTRRLEEVFAGRIQALPRDAREMLLLVALEGTGDLQVLSRCLPGASVDMTRTSALSGLLRFQGTSRVDFRHPLVRSTVVALSTSAERTAVHQRLADVVDGDRRAWHLAEASTGPDDEVAQLLEGAAHTALQKGDAVGAVTLLLRSADLSPEVADRGRRLAEAAYVGADVTGDLDSVRQLLVEAGPSPSLRAAVATAFLLLNSDGEIDTSHRLLLSALRSAQLSGGDEDALHDALHTFLMVCSFGGREELWGPFHQLLHELEAASHVPALLRLCAWSLGDAARTPASAVQEVTGLAAELPAVQDPSRIVQVAVAAFYIDRIGECREALGRVVDDGRRGGAVGSAVSAVAMLAFDDFHSGRWDDAHRLAEEYLELCTRHGYRLLTTPAQLCLGLLAAAKGDGAAVRSLTDEMSAWAAPRGAVKVHNYVHNVLAAAASARGQMETAFWHANAVSRAGLLEPDNSHALWLAFDLVESAVYTGRTVEASAHVAALHEAGVPSLSSRMALVCAGAAAMAAPAKHATALFEAALALPEAERWPFDLARVRLAYGERLRRGRSTTSARVQLQAALAAFQALGATAWADRSRSELLAAGHRGRTVRDQAGPSTLTHQEAVIASLAAKGLTNKEIAAQLRISHRTVGTHLHKVYRRLGISSRALLGDALEG